MGKPSTFQFFAVFFLFQITFPIIFLSASHADDIIVACDISEQEINYLLIQVKAGNKALIRGMDDCKKSNRQLFSQIIDVDPAFFAFASDNLRDDEVFISKFVAQNPAILDVISDRLKSDRFFMSKMTRSYPNALKYASPKLVNNKGFMRQMIKINPRNFEYASARLQNDKEMALLAVKNSGKMLKYASDDLQNDRKVVTEAIKSYSLAINFASEKLQNDPQIKKLSKQIDYKFLNGFSEFLEENYAGIAVGPDGSRGYHIVNMANFFPEKQLIYNPYTVKWESVYKKGTKTNDLKLVVKNINSVSWKEDFADYPDLIKAIEDIFAINKVDPNTVSALNTVSLWQVSDKPKVLAFDLYLLRAVDNKYLKSDFSNVTSLTAIAELKDDGKWEISIVDAIFDADLQMNIAYENGHKKYKIWDLYQTDENDKNPKILFKVEDKDGEYFELFVKQLNGRYSTIYRGGGYAMDVVTSPLNDDN